MTYPSILPGWLNWGWYLIRMSYGSVIMSSGWDTLPILSHPDEIANFDFPHHAVALQRFRNEHPSNHQKKLGGYIPLVMLLNCLNLGDFIGFCFLSLTILFIDFASKSFNIGLQACSPLTLPGYVYIQDLKTAWMSHYKRNKIWWLCLVPTSTTRFASDVGYRMAKN